MFWSYDLHELIELATKREMSVKNICNMLDVPFELVEKYKRNVPLNHEDLNRMQKLTMYLFDIFTENPLDNTYIQTVIDTLYNKYNFSKNTLLNYLEMTDDNLNILLNNQNWSNDDYKKAMKLMHLLLITERYSKLEFNNFK